MAIDKLKIITDCLLKEKEDLESSIKKMTIARDESPLPWESHSDTSRIQADKMLTELNLKHKDLENLLKSLPKEIVKNSDKVRIWSYAVLKNDDLSLKILLVPKGFGGREYDGIKFVSVKTTLGQNLSEKSVKDAVIVNDKNYKVEILE